MLEMTEFTEMGEMSGCQGLQLSTGAWGVTEERRGPALLKAPSTLTVLVDRDLHV